MMDSVLSNVHNLHINTIRFVWIASAKNALVVLILMKIVVNIVSQDWFYKIISAPKLVMMGFMKMMEFVKIAHTNVLLAKILKIA